MIVSDTAVNKSITVMVLAVIIVVFGVYCYNVLPRESDPDITIPNVFVTTSYRGVSPADMETGVTIEIEKKLKGLDGVKKIQSVSSEGLSSINIEFVTGTDIDKALQDVKDKVDEAKGELPTDLEDDPLVFEVNFSELPIVVFSMSGTCGLAALKTIADDLKDDIEAVTGVLEAEVTGGLEREIRVEVFPEKLAYYGMSIPTFQQILHSENQNTSGGAIRLGQGRFQLRVPGEFRTPAEIYGLVMGTHKGQPIYLKDLARVVDGFKEETSRSRLDGRSAVNIAVKKRSGENIIEISNKIDRLIAKQQPSWPRNTEIIKVMDKAKDIRLMVADLENNILSGLILVVVVLFFALGLRNAFLVGLAIPFSMLLSFIVLHILGITLNMVVLFSLTLALGMLVDNAIVIIENIYRYMEQGVPRIEAAKKATSESNSRYLEALSPKTHEKANGEFFSGPGDLDNIENIYIKAVTSSANSIFDANAPNHVGIRFLEMEERKTLSSDTVDVIRERVKNIPGGRITVAVQEEGPPTGAPINIEIAGDDFQMLGNMAKEIRAVISGIPHVKDIRDDFVEGTPSVKVVLDRQKAALFGLTTDMIGFALKTAYNGLDVSSFREGDEDYDITVQLPEENRRVTDVLRELMIPTPNNEMVPLSTIATVEYSGGIGDIVRINNERVVTVKANVDEAKIPGPVARAEAEMLLKQFPLPPGYTIRFTGENEFQQESEVFLTKAFVVACFLIFLILVSQFNSVSQPFIIMTSVILSLGGAFLGLALFRQPFGIIMTGVGVISLAGVVVNNAIVLIDYINKLRERGLALKEAVISAGATRLRPVVLTAITTILGLIPMVTGVSFDFRHLAISWVSESSQWWRSMAVVVIFGLMVATFLTLIVVPTLYSLFSNGRKRTEFNTVAS
ncbi:MAG: efflux RND transporter permease subunit [Deltaproteobacteria bacterium]|nr:efflux RND transporter permease subunit [Deltaproteobacteria bacterium]